jgi:prepilin-type processing-associated H-X9-DG protein
MQIWYCPSDGRVRHTPENIAQGIQSYHWFPNWVWNHTADTSHKPKCGIDLTNNPPDLRSDLAAQRERGVFGWDGPDADTPNKNYNHAMGYNIAYFDGHAKFMPYGRKGSTLPATKYGKQPCTQ